MQRGGERSRRRKEEEEEKDNEEEKEEEKEKGENGGEGVKTKRVCSLTMAQIQRLHERFLDGSVVIKMIEHMLSGYLVTVSFLLYLSISKISLNLNIKIVLQCPCGMDNSVKA